MEQQGWAPRFAPNPLPPPNPPVQPPPAPPVPPLPPAPPVPEPPLAPLPPLPPFPPLRGPIGAGAALLAGALYWLWNWLHAPLGPEYKLPRGKKDWFIVTDFYYCEEFLGNTGKCIRWDKGGNLEEQYIPAASGDTVAYVIGHNGFQVSIGVREYDLDKEDYGPEKFTQTVEGIGSAGAKYINPKVKPVLHYLLRQPDGSHGPPQFPPWGPDPDLSKPPWMPGYGPGPMPSPFPPEAPPAPAPSPAPGPAPDPDPGPNPRPPTPAPAPAPGPGPAPAPSPAPGPGPAPAPAPAPTPGPGKSPAPAPKPIPGPGPAPQPERAPKPQPLPQLPKLAPLIDLLGQLVKAEADELKQTEEETLIIGDIKILSQRTRVDIASIVVELGKLEAKMEALIKRQTPKPLIDEFIDELFEKLKEIEDLINGGDGEGNGKPLEIPDMGPINLDYWAPANYKSTGELEKYEVRIEKQKADKFMEAAMAEMFNYLYKLKVWRQFIAPKRQQGTPYRIVWEEVPEDE